MTSYILDIKTSSHLVLNRNESLPLMYSHNRTYVEYYFKLDSNGNINISKFQKTQDGKPYRYEGGIEQVLSINDNIPIPDYFINIIKFLINPITSDDIKQFEYGKSIHEISTERHKLESRASGRNGQLIERYWEIVIDVIKKIKDQVKEIIENPKDSLDIKTQLNAYISKTNQQQENIVELETKIENIQTAYFDVLNENKKLKEIIKTKNNKQIELESEINKLKGDINSRKQLDEYNKQQHQKMEELEKERVWKEYKQNKQNYDPLYR